MAAIGNLTQYGNNLNQMATMLPEMKAPENFETKLKSAMKSAEQAELKSACEEMEAYMLSMVYKQMRNSTTLNSDTSFLPKGDYEKMFEDYMVDNQVENMIDAGGVGFADFMYKQLSVPQIPMTYNSNRTNNGSQEVQRKTLDQSV
ncbi:hypothetical protein AN643_00135 [Candidatus Epulonipiscioides saccharophilum]|nr:hypothetical protein AN643_00135 [Epulopiscium sp. SCG-B10WGA-EpuloB]